MSAPNTKSLQEVALKLLRLGAGWVIVCVGLSWLGASAAAQIVYSQTYSFTTLAGTPKTGSADGVGTLAQFNFPVGVAVDSGGNLFVADTGNSTIRKITPGGVVTTLAGLAGNFGGLDGTGSSARFFSPNGVAVDSASNVYVADTGNSTIRKVTPGGVVTTLAGLAGVSGTNDATGSAARFNGPFGVAVDRVGNVYVADTGNSTIRKVTPGGVVTTLAGTAGVLGAFDGTGGAAQFNGPSGVAVDGAGNVFVTDTLNDTIREINFAGVVTTIAGLGDFDTNSGPMTGSDDGLGTNAQFDGPIGIALDTHGNIFVADTGNDTIRELTPSGMDWMVSTFAGSAGDAGYYDTTSTNAEFDGVSGLAVDNSGNIYVGDTVNSLIRVISSAGRVTTVAGEATSFGSVDGTGSAAEFYGPASVAADGAGNCYVADAGNFTIRKITPDGLVTTIAGSAGNYGSDDGVGANALFGAYISSMGGTFGPQGVAADRAGNVYVADSPNNTIRKITPAGTVSTIAGWAQTDTNGDPAFGSNDGQGTNASFNFPCGIAVDTNGTLYVADTYNNTIRKITPSGMVSTLAGSAGNAGTNNGAGTNALFDSPVAVAVDSAGMVYVADGSNNTIRMVTPAGLVTTLAGLPEFDENTNPIPGGADGTGSAARFNYPGGVAVDSADNIYVADTGNSTIRKITSDGTNWVVSTIAGALGVESSADGGGSAALFDLPLGVAVDSAGNVYVADTGNNTIRKGVFSQYATAIRVPFTRPLITGQLMVTLVPPEANGQWRLATDLGWRNSGTTATNLAEGEYNVEFRNTPGYLALPLYGPVAVTDGGTTYLTDQYYPTILPSDNSAGSLTVNIGPSPPAGAGWRFLGSATPFLPPGYSTNLVGGTYLIQFAPVAGFVTPASLSVQVEPGLPTVLDVTYLLASAPPVGISLPVPVPSANIDDLAHYPYGFNGQLQTDVGYGSGVAVQTNVVLTAAHLIFNDQTLSYASEAYWLYQEEAGVFAPYPLEARGWYVLSGYAAQRTNDVLGGLGPGQSSPQSRNFDVAALYFPRPVANGGYGGWLPSDASPNTWLASSAEKLLVGYPVDGSQFGFTNVVNGEMYEIGPESYPLSPAANPVEDQQVYTASWFLSYPGNSGGPLEVQLNGYYYPAGVYLGTLFNGVVPYASAVRAIDSNVVNLITLAAALGDTGTNNSGGGIITIIPSLAASRNNPAYLLLKLGPPAAVQAGAAWKLASQSAAYYSSANPSLQEITSTNALVVQFKPIPGWNVPASQSIAVVTGEILTNTAYYTVTNPILSLDLVRGLGLSGTTNTTYLMQRNTIAKGGAWLPYTTNTITSTGFNLVTNKPSPGFYRAFWLTN